ncbi:MAG: GNAT family N-acetyltransferase [Methanolinea sp.]|nr:GNAT family N-acetyltransferase [Methanolinea sp.]
MVVIGIVDENVYFGDPSLPGTRGMIRRDEFISRWHDQAGETPFGNRSGVFHHAGIFIRGSRPASFEKYTYIDPQRSATPLTHRQGAGLHPRYHQPHPGAAAGRGCVTGFFLETERLILEDLGRDDLSNIGRIAGNPDVMRYVLIWLDTDAQVAAFFERAVDESQKAPRNSYILAARVKATGEFAGLTFLEIDPAQESTGEVGIVLLPEFQACGYGKEILRKYLEFGFCILGLHRVFGKCDERNLASARLMEQCGLTYEGTIREHVWLRDHWRSTRYYGMLDREYIALRPGLPQGGEPREYPNGVPRVGRELSSGPSGRW